MLQMRCNQVHDEVDQFIDSYISALEKHRQALQLQVQEAQEAKLHMVRAQQLELERHAEDTRNAVSFAEDLLAESSDIEVVLILHFLSGTSKLSQQNQNLYNKRTYNVHN
jgi:tripartite motif-containing protein 45